MSAVLLVDDDAPIRRMLRQRACAALIELVSECGFHGRRAKELAIWSEAIRCWRQERGDARRSRMRDLRAALQQARRFGASTMLPLPNRRTTLLGYISGLVCAEGSFGIYNGRPRFSMHLRADDALLLQSLAAATRLGRVYHYAPPAPANPSVMWVINAGSELETLMNLLREGGLRGRKRLQMEVWAEAVDELTRARRSGSRACREILDGARRRLASLREYQPPEPRELRQLGRRDVAADCVATLQKWGQVYDGPLSATAYAHWRSSAEPTRNTVAAAFGSWHAALEAAGLRHRAAREPRRVGGEERRCRNRRMQRERVRAAVLRCACDIGRAPAAMEFFRWRLAEEPASPAQATVYRLFPDGWGAVLRACGARPRGGVRNAQSSLKQGP